MHLFTNWAGVMMMMCVCGWCRLTLLLLFIVRQVVVGCCVDVPGRPPQEEEKEGSTATEREGS